MHGMPHADMANRCQWCGLLLGDDLAHYTRCSVMLAALQQIRPFLYWSWVPEGHAPCVPNASLRSFGLDLGSIEEATDLLLWIDFLHSLYSGGTAPAPTVEQWRRAWVARQRVVNRFWK